jgi:hypothetical protein
VYELEVAPLILVQSAPLGSQSSQAFEYVGAGEPTMTRYWWSAVPCCAVPDAAGAAVFDRAVPPVEPPPSRSNAFRGSLPVGAPVVVGGNVATLRLRTH